MSPVAEPQYVVQGAYLIKTREGSWAWRLRFGSLERPEIPQAVITVSADKIDELNFTDVYSTQEVEALDEKL
jgi:hypothetical protein